MGISFAGLSGGGSNTSELVYGPGEHSVNIAEGYYDIKTAGKVYADSIQLFDGFQYLQDTQTFSIGPARPEVWSLTDQTATAQNLNDIAYGQGKYVAVGNSGAVLQSTDGGSSWQNIQLGVSRDFQAVAYGDGIWITTDFASNAYGTYSDIHVSTDGANTWNSYDKPTNEGILDIAYGDGIFMVSAYEGQVATSTNGVTWTVRSLPGTQEILSVGYGDGRWVVGKQDELYTSTDTINWSSAFDNNVTGFDYYSIAYGNGLWIAAGGGSGGKKYAYRSSDGINWQQINENFSENITAVVYAGVWVMASQGQLKISTDNTATNWITANFPFESTDYNASGLVANNGFVTLVGSQGSIATSQVGINPESGLLLTQLPEAIEL